ncbi:MAG TPA: Holliday junction branch migration protein RuvA [Tepidisphaeraceae bacterium]|nr:Holliday junction branch migration protein RuvA [Tepidisphaeraceae bacterium]
MIASLTGELREVQEERVHLQVGPILYELLVPAADGAALLASVGETLTLHTILYLEGDPNRGNLEPRLIGFMRASDKRFFERFTTVKGIGVKTALRALTVPVGEIAKAIESRDARFLVGLDGIGRRTAELIVAELSGKVTDFATGYGDITVAPLRQRWSPEEEAAIALATGPQMGLRRADAERLLQRVKSANPAMQAAEQLLPEMLRLYTSRG